MAKSLLILFSFLSCFSLLAQELTIEFVDKKEGFPIQGVYVRMESLNNGDDAHSMMAVSDSAGLIHITILKRDYKLFASALGYNSWTSELTFSSNVKPHLKISLTPKVMALEEYVVSASRHEQRLQEITSSMEVLTAKEVAEQNVENAEELLNNVPGLTVNKGQVNIRGSSGWVYGVGSRVLMLVDGLPLISADVNDIKFNALPIEAVEQVEVVKGAASAIYGASAMDGVVNMITITPTNDPVTWLSYDYGFFDAPQRSSLKYWTNPIEQHRWKGLHHNKVKNTAYALSFDIRNDEGIYYGDSSQFKRLWFKVEQSSSKIEGLKFGLSGTLMDQDKFNFLFWKNIDSAYYPVENTMFEQAADRVILDPFISYYSKSGWQHKLINRGFYTRNIFPDQPETNSEGVSIYNEYQVKKSYYFSDENNLRWTSGLVHRREIIRSPILFGNHAALQRSGYVQLNGKYKRLNVALGGRLETNKVDTFGTAIQPVLRLGVNYGITPYTNIRFSKGQGYRFPSVAELYSSSNLTAVPIIPNPNLKPEYGNSFEIGLSQLWKLGIWSSKIDLAYYNYQYTDVVEFVFAYQQQIGPHFTSANLEDSKITGIEVLLDGQVGNDIIKYEYGWSYNYLLPIDLNYVFNPDLDTVGNEELLKYRYQHNIKLNNQITFKNIKLGALYQWQSHVTRIDDILTVFIKDLAEYDAQQRLDYKGIGLLNLNMSYTYKKHWTINANVKNLMNREFMIFPGNLGPSRQFKFGLRYTF